MISTRHDRSSTRRHGNSLTPACRLRWRSTSGSWRNWRSQCSSRCLMPSSGTVSPSASLLQISDVVTLSGVCYVNLSWSHTDHVWFGEVLELWYEHKKILHVVPGKNWWLQCFDLFIKKTTGILYLKCLAIRNIVILFGHILKVEHVSHHILNYQEMLKSQNV